MSDIDILQAFGTSLIEFEETLYQKYLLLSAGGSLITPDMFKDFLLEMEKKGYVNRAMLHGKQCWKREVSVEDLDVALPITNISDSPRIREFIRARYNQEGKIDAFTVSESHRVERIMGDMMYRVLINETSDANKAGGLLKHHARELHKALATSQSRFIRYLRSEIPKLEEPLKELLEEKGENIILIGLHLIESEYSTK